MLHLPVYVYKSMYIEKNNKVNFLKSLLYWIFVDKMSSS